MQIIQKTVWKYLELCFHGKLISSVGGRKKGIEDEILSHQLKKIRIIKEKSPSLSERLCESCATKIWWTCEGFSFMRDTINIPNPKFQFITVRKEIEVEVASEGESEALRTKRRLPTSVSTPYWSPLVKKKAKNFAWKRRREHYKGNGKPTLKIARVGIPGNWLQLLPNCGKSKRGCLLGHVSIVPVAPFPLNQIVVEVLQISTSPWINRQLMELKDPYNLPRKFGLWWCSVGDSTKAVWIHSRSIILAAITKTWKIKLFPNPLGKTTRTACPSNKKATALRCSNFKLAVKSKSLSIAFRNKTSLSTILLFSYTGHRRLWWIGWHFFPAPRMPWIVFG